MECVEAACRVNASGQQSFITKSKVWIQGSWVWNTTPIHLSQMTPDPLPTLCFYFGFPDLLLFNWLMDLGARFAIRALESLHQITADVQPYPGHLLFHVLKCGRVQRSWKYLILETSNQWKPFLSIYSALLAINHQITHGICQSASNLERCGQVWWLNQSDRTVLHCIINMPHNYHTKMQMCLEKQAL